MSTGTDVARPRSPRRLAVLAAAALVAGMLPVVATVAPAQAAVPASPTFTVPLDTVPDYQGQEFCSPTVKPGSAKLRDLLRATYGNYSIGIVRACSIGGQSEHKEGRALDWMVSVRNATQKSKAQAFLAWLLAPDAAGNPGAMARRLGIMYIGWNNQMWRGYDMASGWTELRGCYAAAKASTAYDTECHRNHVHLSLTWEGAMGLTSYWSGTPVNATCRSGWTPEPSAPVAGGGLIPVAPVRVLDTRYGVGVASPCRLGAPRWSGDAAALSVNVAGRGDVPAEGVAAVALRVTQWGASALTPTVVVRSTGTAPGIPFLTAQGTGVLTTSVVAPVAGDGTVRFTMDRGTTELRVEVVGYSLATGAPTPPASASATSGSVRVVAPAVAQAGLETALAPGESRTVALSGVGGAPSSGLHAVSLSLASGRTGTVDLVSVLGSGSVAATLRTSTGTSQVLHAFVPTTDGTVVVRNAGATPVTLGLRLDGWFLDELDAAAGVLGTLAAPVTVVDTGAGIGISSDLTTGATRSVVVTGRNGIPSGARAVLVEVSARAATAGVVMVSGLGTVPGVSFPAGAWGHQLVLVPLKSYGTLGLGTTVTGTRVAARVVAFVA